VKMAIKAVIFDLGGVLVRTEFPEVRQHLEERLGFPPGTLGQTVWGGENWQLAQIGRISYEEYWRRVGAALGFSTEEDIRDFRREYFSGDRVDEQLVSLIKELRPRYKIGLLSNAPDRLGIWLDEEGGIKDLFDSIVYSAEVGVAKPDHSIFHLSLEQLDVVPSEALFVDDYHRNIDAALALGMQAIRFTSTRTLREEIQQYVDLGREDAEP
jgi:epoxide hydrolase-like predicted phosphatase